MDAPDPQPPPPDPAWKEFARAPLVPVALAASAGLVVDRYADVPLAGELLAAVGGLVGWAASLVTRSPAAAAWLWLTVAAVAAAHHHDHRHRFAADDIGQVARDQPVPVKLRGTLDEEPARHPPPKPDPLRTFPTPAATTTVLAVERIDTPDGWRPASGRARLTVEGRLDGLHVGDAVEVVGRLYRPSLPSNPGEVDYRGRLLDRRITAEVRTKHSADGVVRVEEGWRGSLFGWLAAARGWGGRVFADRLPPDEAAVASALLLGDTTAMDREEWDAYIRTGVVHVLAVSGQHLVVVGWFVWLLLKVGGVRRRYGAWVVAGVMIGYALLTGFRPSAVRAAVMVSVVCGGLVLRRPVVPANAFALAWLVVLGVNPADPFTAGCQLSFLSVFVLVWGAGRWLAPRPLTTIEELIEESRTTAERIVRRIARLIGVAYAVSFILSAVNAPLVLAWQNLATPVGVLLGPPLVLLTAVALIAGLVLLLLAPLGLGWMVGWVVEWSLAGCGWLVGWAERLPGGWVYAPAPAGWWLVGFYAGVAGVVLPAGRWRRRAIAGLGVWTVLGLTVTVDRPPTDELRVTFLAVGHGGCVVLETPDGRTLVYDAGTTGGPDAVRRVVAPYLWHRGVTRIDEVFLSHADLDHFNGVPELLKRFAVGQVTLTPSFRDKPTPGVHKVLEAIDRHGVPWRVARAGDRREAGDVTVDVLHPPAVGPNGNENARSLVLLVRHAGHSVLLTGDLEGPGQDVLTQTPGPEVDVMLAPHHGAKGANPGRMAGWVRPRLVVSSQQARPTDHLKDAYRVPVWDTPTAGTVTVRSHPTGLTATAFRSGEVTVVRRGR